MVLIRKMVLAFCLVCFAGTVWAGATSNNDKNGNSTWDSKDRCSCDSSQSAAQGNKSSGTDSNASNGSVGMPVYSFKSMLAGLSLTDTPLSYTPPVGQAINFTFYYNAREANQPTSFDAVNLGQKWTSNWITYIQDNPSSPGQQVFRYAAGGGGEPYAGYNASTGQFTPEENNAAVLVRVSADPITYELRFADGSKDVFAASGNKTSYPRNVFLTQKVDAQGNAVTLDYDGQLRLTSVTDAIGQSSTFQYGNVAFPLAITSVTDPFGRQASMTYDSLGRLASITDAIGMTSTFTYEGSGTFINSMTTPYGTTTFAQTKGWGSSTELSVQATDPMGYTERTEYRHAAPGIAFSESRVPAGVMAFNRYINYRNSFYWDKSAFAKACSLAADGKSQCDYTQARIKHFLHNNQGETARTLESIKYPLESRIWYNYQGQSWGGIVGSLDKPTKVGRVLSDGSTQLTRYQYNAQGKVTQEIDPTGRETDYTYAANGIDLLQVQQKTATGVDVLASYTWNDQHQPLSYTDAAGQTTSYTYNARGQRTSVTNALGQATTFTYDSNGYLTTVTNALGRIQRRLTYDNTGRIATDTDAEGYTLAYEYDALNRVTRITYPDGTSRQFVWDKLDLASVTDREGHTTTYQYDANRNRISQTDPLGQVTRYSYYPNGKLQTLTDPNGNTTTWERDIQGRVVAKTYTDGQGDTFAYDNASRLISKTDALGQTTHYRYTVDGKLAGVDYTNALNPTPSVSFIYGASYPRLVQMTDGHGATDYRYYLAGAVGANLLQAEQGADPHDSLQYTYDALGRPVSRSVDGSVETFTYDALGRLTGNHNALGNFANQYLGDTAQLTGQQAAGVPYQVAYQYEDNLNDRRLKAILNESQTSHQAPPWPWPLNLFLPQPDPITVTQPVVSYQFTTSPEGRITSRSVTSSEQDGNHHHHGGWHWGWQHNGHHALPEWERDIRVWFYGQGHDDQAQGATTNYQYDALGQLLSASGADTANYQYDAAGNLVLLAENNGSTTLTPNALNQVASTNTASYQYDANGNLLDDGKRTYTWDAADRLLSATDKVTGNTSVFAYDGFSRRISETTIDNSGATPVTTTITNLWCGERLCEQRDASGNASTRYYAQGEVQNGTAYLYAQDQVGSVVAMVSTDGTVAGRTSYSPYGSITSQSGVQPKIAYAGLYHHSSTGLYLATYRAYDPATAHWLKRDPIREAGGINLYGYVMGNPISYRDTDGLIGICDLKLKKCRVQCARNPFAAGACMAKCEGQYGALSQCENKKQEPPKQEEKCPAKEPEADPNNPDCTFDKWKNGECEK